MGRIRRPDELTLMDVGHVETELGPHPSRVDLPQRNLRVRKVCRRREVYRGQLRRFKEGVLQPSATSMHTRVVCHNRARAHA
eukprot:scaffold17860_cov73-Phaeocystis_antarctica.AAC.5